MATLSHCNNCRVAASLAVARDQTCERPLNPRAGEDVQILGLRIARGAKHGRAGTSSFMIAYSPAKGYIGADQFVVEFAWRRGPETGKVFIDFDVTVK